jgi:hypothetical protein
MGSARISSQFIRLKMEARSLLSITIGGKSNELPMMSVVTFVHALKRKKMKLFHLLFNKQYNYDQNILTIISYH